VAKQKDLITGRRASTIPGILREGSGLNVFGDQNKKSVWVHDINWEDVAGEMRRVEARLRERNEPSGKDTHKGRKGRDVKHAARLNG